jgi:hypothetical protein
MNNLNTILNRDILKNNILNIIKNFDNEKKGIFIHGDNGIGKTTFIKNLLHENSIDYIYYDSTDIRSANFIDNLQESNTSNMNVISLFKKTPKLITIIIDDIDNIQCNDKSLLNNLIKLVRIKKTKKQKLEKKTNSQIIFIGKKDSEKKILELMKVCNVFKINLPTKKDIFNIFDNYIKNKEIIKEYYNKLFNYTQYNFHKIFNIINILNDDSFDINIINELIYNISISKNIRHVTKNIINNNYNYKNNIISENDRTIVGLLYHENIIDILNSKNKDHINIYYKFLENYCNTDYIDRIIYQKQIWQLNDLNFIIKILKNNYILCNFKNKYSINNINEENIRFTKILTKYSTEYNNNNFINNIAYELTYNIKDIYNYFLYIFKNYENDNIIDFLKNYNISSLDISRMKKILSYHFNIQDN